MLWTKGRTSGLSQGQWSGPRLEHVPENVKKKKVQKLDTASLEGSLVFKVNIFCLTHFEFKIVVR